MEFNEQDWVSIVDYARTFNVSDMTVRRRIKTGKIPAELFNGKYYIPKMEVERRNARTNRPQHRDRPASTVERGQGVKVNSPINAKTSDGPSLHRSTPEIFQSSLSLISEPQRSYSAPKVEFQMPSHQAPLGERTSHPDRSMIELCKDTMRLARESEEKSKALFEEKAELFKEKESNYRMRIQTLEQKVEDLELLVTVLETKMGPTKR